MDTELFDKWQADLRRRNLRPRTLATYNSRLGLLRRWAGNRSLLTLTTEDLEGWLDERHLLGASRKGTIAALRSFYRWAQAHDLLERDPTVRLQVPRVPRGRPRPLSDRQMHDGLAGADDETRLILLLGALGGLRSSEIGALRVEDVDLDAGLLEVVEGKGGRSRMVPLHPDLADALAHEMPRRGFVLHNGDGTPLSHKQIWLRVHRATGGMTTHQLRHTAATMLWSSCHDLLTVAEVLGHEDIGTTRVYARFDLGHAAEVVRAMDASGWNSPPPPRAAAPPSSLRRAA